MINTFTAVLPLLTLAISLPTPTTAHQHPTVQLLTLGPSANHNSNPQIQNGLANFNNGHIINIPLGTSISSLEQNPLQLQGLELLGVEGAALDDVECKANIGFSSASVTVSVRDGMKMLDANGKVLKVTGLSCVVIQTRRMRRDEKA